jgi:hypothetical protein
MPFSIPDLTNMVQQLRDLYVNLHFEKQLPHALQRTLRDTKPTLQVSPSFPPPPPPFSLSLILIKLYTQTHHTLFITLQEWNCLKLGVHNLLCSLYERDCRRPFCPKNHWDSLHLNQIPPDLFYDNQGIYM